MAVVQQGLTTFLADRLSAYIDRGRVKLDGVSKEMPIFKTTIDGNKVRKFLYLVEEKGKISEACLLNASGAALAVKPMSMTKAEDGVMVVFEFDLDIKN